MPDPTPTPVSPTGKPLVSARLVPYILAALVVVGALIAAGAGETPVIPSLKPARDWLGIVEVVLMGLLGSSPGLRRAALVLLCLAPVALGATSCAHVDRRRLETDLARCASGFLTSEVQAVLPDVAGALQGKSADWQAQLDGVLLRAGTAGVCALLALVQSLEGGTGGSPGAMPVVLLAPDKGGLPPAVVLLRGYAYLDSRR